MNFSFPTKDIDIEKIDNMKRFLVELIKHKKQTIAYEYDYFKDSILDRLLFYENFEILENIISNTLNSLYNNETNDFVMVELSAYTSSTLINILNITNKLKCLIKSNINLNLLLDRYIIEITEELVLCKK